MGVNQLHTPRANVDFNADLGESFGVFRYGEDDGLLPLLSSANVACGFKRAIASGVVAAMGLKPDDINSCPVVCLAWLGVPEPSRARTAMNTMLLMARVDPDINLSPNS